MYMYIAAINCIPVYMYVHKWVAIDHLKQINNHEFGNVNIVTRGSWSA